MGYAVFPGEPHHHLLKTSEQRTFCGLRTKGEAGDKPGRRPPARVTVELPEDAPPAVCPKCEMVESLRKLERAKAGPPD